MYQAAGVIALALSLGAMIPYIVESIQGKVRPERVSWLIWTLLGVVYFWTAIVEDGAVLFTAGELVGPIIAFVLALIYGVGGRSKLDLVMLALALTAIIWLVFTDNTLISLILALVADGIALVLTIRKLHIDPVSESRWAWAVFGLSGVFGMISINNYTVETLAFPIYVVVGSTYIAIKAGSKSSKPSVDLEQL